MVKPDGGRRWRGQSGATKPAFGAGEADGGVGFGVVGVEGRCRVCPVVWGKNEAASDTPIRENQVSLRVHSSTKLASTYSYPITVTKQVSTHEEFLGSCLECTLFFGAFRLLCDSRILGFSHTTPRMNIYLPSANRYYKIRETEWFSLGL